MSSRGSFSRIRPPYFDIGLSGKYYNSGRGPVSVPNGQSFRLNLVNPAASGVLMMVHRFRYYTTNANNVVTVRLNATTNLPSFALTAASQRLGAANGLCTLAADANASPMSGGATLPYQLPMEASKLTEYQIFPHRIIGPNNSIGTDMINNGGGTDSVVFILDWIELPLDT